MHNDTRKWTRPDYLDKWGPPPFQNERYLFDEDMRQKHYDAMTWAGAQIANLMRAATDVISELGGNKQEAMELLKRKLREERRKEGEELAKEMKPEDRNARTIGHLIMRWEAALGVSGEIMINTPDRFLRRFYGGDPWDKQLNAYILDIMGAEGEGLAQGINPKLTFRTNRYSCGGDPFDEWVVESVEEESVGRHERIPDGSDR